MLGCHEQWDVGDLGIDERMSAIQKLAMVSRCYEAHCISDLCTHMSFYIGVASFCCKPLLTLFIEVNSSIVSSCCAETAEQIYIISISFINFLKILLPVFAKGMG